MRRNISFFQNGNSKNNKFYECFLFRKINKSKNLISNIEFKHVTSTSSKITVVRVLKITGSRSD